MEKEDFESSLLLCFSAMRSYVRNRILNPYDSEDIVQEVMLAALQNHQQAKRIAIVKAWVLGIARNKCNDYYRQRYKREKEAAGLVSILSLKQGGNLGFDDMIVVRETMDRLSSTDKQVLALYYYQDLPLKTIAQKLSLPVGTVKSKLFYIRKKLKKEIDDDTD